MRVTRLYLRNYRTFEDPVELELPGGLVGVYGPNGSGKCLPGPTRVWDGETGEPIPIEQFVKGERKSMLGCVGGKVSRVPVVDWHDLGEKPTVIVRLASGAQIETAGTHRLMTDRGCVAASDLTSDHWVAETRSLPAVAAPLVTNDEAFILGLLLGDGCVTDRVNLTAADPEVIDAYRSAIERTFPGCTIRSMPKRGSPASTNIVVSALSNEERRRRRIALAHRLIDSGVPLHAYLGPNTPRFLRGAAGLAWETMDALEADYGLDLWDDRCALHGNRVMIEWVRSFGLLGSDCRTKRIPPSLLLGPKEQVAHLLAGLWLTDGYVGFLNDNRGRWRSIEVSYGSASSGLVDDVRILLLRLDLRSNRRTRLAGGHEFHEVVLTSQAQSRLDAIPLVGVKATRARAIVQRYASINSNPNCDLIPPSFCADLPTRSASGRERTKKQLARHGMSRETYLDFGGKACVSEADTMWSRVVSVTPTGASVPCFDVTVDTPDHLYIAETFITHNSSLVEAIPFALYGRSRTTKDEIRTTGVGADCVVEVELEHEDHLYLVRRTISGSNHTIKATAYCDRLQVAEGARDTTRYAYSVLGMDDAAFRASVFAEQKQLAAFSEQTPAERRRLVLQLLGITPLELARDRARRDARLADDQLQRLRHVLPDLDALRAGLVDAETAAKAAALADRTAEAAAIEAAKELETAQAAVERREAIRQQHDLLVERGKAVRGEHDAAVRRSDELAAELADLEGAAGRLAELEELTSGLSESEEGLALLEAVGRAERGVAAVRLPPRPEPPDEQAAEEARTEADCLRSQAAELDGRLAGARSERERAEQARARSSELSGEEDCPTCGQPLGGAFEQVQRHRAAELAEAEAAVDRLTGQQAEAAERARAATRRAEQLLQEVRAARDRWTQWVGVVERREAAVSELATAVGSLEEAARTSGEAWRVPAASVLGVIQHSPELADESAAEPIVDDAALTRVVRELREAVVAGRAAAAECARLKGRLERRQTVTSELESARRLVAETEQRLVGLRREVAELGHSPDELAATHRARDETSTRASAATADARRASLAAERARAHAESEGKRLAEAEEQHAMVFDLGEEARHLGRLAELLSSFRNSLVATAGPRLSAQAAELFAELTDHEYDLLEVDPETYEIQICDQGVVHGMDRFSGSEKDLANLSLRVAISEQVRFQSGGAVGLLVLDEVFGPLDEGRKERMLLALERLRGRFRQVVVVTHADDIKEQLPSAVEVVKLPGRRATARLI